MVRTGAATGCTGLPVQGHSSLGHETGSGSECVYARQRAAGSDGEVERVTRSRSVCSARLDPRTCLRTAFGPKRMRSALRITSFSPGSLWPSPLRPSVSLRTRCHAWPCQCHFGGCWSPVCGTSPIRINVKFFPFFFLPLPLAPPTGPSASKGKSFCVVCDRSVQSRFETAGLH